MQSLQDGSYYACKRMKQRFESMEQVNSLREIQALRRLNPHPNILTLHEVVFDRKSGCLALVCELMDMNIYELIRGRRQPLPEKTVMCYMYQLCLSLDHMHRNGIFHRDVKPENILIKLVLKLGDFGSCRSVYSKQPYTEYISTRWYRAPECLLTDGFYTYKMDLWSAGCVFYEIASLRPLFPGANELDQISKIHDVIGTPAQETLTKFKQSRAMNFDFAFTKGSGIPLPAAKLSPQCLSLLRAMLAYDPDMRIAAHQALQHPYFREQRAAERQVMACHQEVLLPEHPSAPEPPSHSWQVAKQATKQKALKQQDSAPRRVGLGCAGQSPQAGLLSQSSPLLPAVLGPRPCGKAQLVAPAGRVLVAPLERPHVLSQADAQRDVRPQPRSWRLPTIDRKVGRY
ncbi:MAPK/MAK/MRK overlapping kinase isoform X2 [Ochotona princeps]|uniref:MAPK/MAK/MRK overlapping kinase isoform X2 n=1 Tax=Ochotona princeps TaxID=9978 RepID=UPI002714DD14|nr:MAPK/MAK/MRK overlapping kinase isoform X2 [Ochotona princeps]